ncbi:nucleotide exchange factor GrpE [Candidatus Bathyarchaeota archaeon]|nr:MAG: nucleotide exchange factor GrpE [Candidatus Bathyarchaeota archaeon]
MYPRRKRASMHGNQETTTTTRETQEPKPSQSKSDDQVKGPTSMEQTGPPEVEEELQKEREKSEDYLRRLQYLQADFENYRKRAEREMGDVKRYGNERLLSDLLVVVDELELGLEKAREGDNSPALVEGIRMVLKRFQGLLSKEGVVRIEGVGSRFDPSLHEAALKIPSEKEEGTIIEEIRSGYTLKGRVLRPSIVKVAEGSEPSSSTKNGQYKTENIVEEEE